MKKVVSLLLSVVLMVGLVLPASAAETSYPTFESGVQEIQKYGNIVLDVEPEKLHHHDEDHNQQDAYERSCK